MLDDATQKWRAKYDHAQATLDAHMCANEAEVSANAHAAEGEAERRYGVEQFKQRFSKQWKELKKPFSECLESEFGARTENESWCEGGVGSRPSRRGGRAVAVA